jgi:hypothetical protein
MLESNVTSVVAKLGMLHQHQNKIAKRTTTEETRNQKIREDKSHVWGS